MPRAFPISSVSRDSGIRKLKITFGKWGNKRNVTLEGKENEEKTWQGNVDVFNMLFLFQCDVAARHMAILSGDHISHIAFQLSVSIWQNFG